VEIIEVLFMNWKFMTAGLLILGALSAVFLSQYFTGAAGVGGSNNGPAGSGWKDTLLTDVGSGQSFRISDFKGKTILLESFAVWCPTCKQQQDQIKELEGMDDSIVHISLNTDPNEEESRVREHMERNGFDWYFAVSPAEMTRELVAEVGLGIVNAPGAPVVLICGDQSTRFLKSGVKSASELTDEVHRGC